MRRKAIPPPPHPHLLDELAEEEERGIKAFIKGLEKRHFLCLTSIIGALSMSLFFINNARKLGAPIGWGLTGWFILAALIIACATIAYGLKKEMKPLRLATVLERIFPLISIVLVLVVVYFVLEYALSGILLSAAEVTYMTCVALIAETITFHYE